MKMESKQSFRRTRHFKEDGVRLPNEISRARPWLLSITEELDKVIYRKDYGNVRISVNSNRGGLRQADEAVFIALLAIVKEPDKDTLFTAVDIGKAMDLQNPYDPNAHKAIGESLERLRDARVTVRIKTKDGRSVGKFNFLSGYLDYQGKKFKGGSIKISGYLTEIKRLELGYYWLRRGIYYNLRSDISKSLYSYLNSQRNIYNGQEYQIRLSKLCEYINYKRGNRPWTNVWQVIKRALSQLQEQGAINSFKRDAKGDYKDDGGLITITGMDKESIAKLQESKQKNKKKRKDERTLPVIWNPRREAINLIKVKLEEIIGPVTIDDKTDKQLEQNLKQLEKKYEDYPYIGITSLMEAYLYWLKEESNIKYFTASLFSPESPFFTSFIDSDMAKSNLNWNKEKRLSMAEIMAELADDKERPASRRKEFEDAGLL